LMVAARLDLVAAAGILLAHGATLDRGASDLVAQADGAGDARCRVGEAAASDTPGRTALSYAAQLASTEMVRLLLDHGASAAKADSAGRRPADYVKRRTGDPASSAKIAEMLR
jgi:ankyrin repeat protein